jgi:hypothetical protein
VERRWRHPFARRSRSGGYLDSSLTDSTIAFLTDLSTRYGVAPKPGAFRAVSGTESRLF